jgi:hypothetical protein
MMNKPQGTKRPKMSSGSARCESAFETLPPLGTEEYVNHIRTAGKAAFPPEVLVRAFRQLPPGSEASKETLKRLFLLASSGKSVGSWRAQR